MTSGLVQNMQGYTEEQHTTWRLLYERQRANLDDKASPLYLQCLDAMVSSLTREQIPSVQRMEAQLSEHTQWTLKVVPGLIPADEFFELLARRCFCTSTWVRKRSQFDYIEEPDMFHDTFGHIPPLLDPEYAEFMHEFGTMGWQLAKAGNTDALLGLQRLYWYFVEFGFLADAAGQPKLIGAGIMSSFGETNHAWSLRNELSPFKLADVMNTPYRTDTIQTQYFLLSNIDAMRRELGTWFETVAT